MDSDADGADGVAAELDFPGEVAREDGTDVFRRTEVSTVREDLTAEFTMDDDEDDEETDSFAIDATGEEERSAIGEDALPFAIDETGGEERSATGEEALSFAVDAPAPIDDVEEEGSSDC